MSLVYESFPGFLVGGTGPSHWRMELGPIPLVGMAGLSKTLMCLSVDEWGSVSSLFIVCPEESQHWSLQAVW